MASSQRSTAVESQTTFCLWFHYCYVSCTSSWHDHSDPQTTYLLSNFETNLNVDTSTINDKDVKIWRLDLLNNSDGDATKRSSRAEDVAAEEDRMEGYLNSIEKECEKVFENPLTPSLSLATPVFAISILHLISPPQTSQPQLAGHTTERIFYDPNDDDASTSDKASGTHIFSHPTDIMKSLPAGYALMHRVRSNTTNRAGDLHLWGHPSGLDFNSAAKFVKHLKWLIKGRVGDCECPPCNGQR
ncbi:hypothetical protein KCU77_g13809, partial [Aureobasidium melanogenum]